MKTLAKLCPWSSNSSTRRSPRGAESNTWYLSLGEVREIRKNCGYCRRFWLQPPWTVLKTQTRSCCMAGGKKDVLLWEGMSVWLWKTTAKQGALLVLCPGHPSWPATSCSVWAHVQNTDGAPSKGIVRLNSFLFMKRLCVFWIQVATEAKHFPAYRHCGDTFIRNSGRARCSLPVGLTHATKSVLFSAAVFHQCLLTQDTVLSTTTSSSSRGGLHRVKYNCWPQAEIYIPLCCSNFLSRLS